jgi:2-dehydropantoate 2-reductase
MPTIAIIGPGAIGCAVGSALAEAFPTQVLFCANTPFPHLHVTFPTGQPIDLPAHVATTPEGLQPVDWILLCVKAPQVPSASPWLQALAAPTTKVAVLQNGVEHRELITPLIGNPARILPVVVQIPAERTAPGAVTLSGDPHLVVPDDDPGRSLQQLFQNTRIPVKTTPDFLRAAWEKLCLNAANGSITALTCRDQTVLRQPEVADLARAIVRECIAVGRAEGATLDDQLPDQVVARLATGGGNSMLYDRQNGRELEADARNGVIARLGQKHSIPTPINSTLYALLKNVLPDGPPARGAVTGPPARPS